MHHDRQRVARGMQPFAVLPEATDGAQQVELLQVTLLKPVNFREVKECLIGQFHVGHTFKDVLEFLPGFIVLFLPKCQQAIQKFRAYRNAQIRVLLHLLENHGRLVKHLLRHVGFADPKPCLKGVRGARITVGHRGVFRARHVKALTAEVAFRQQQLHARLGIIALLLAFGLVRVRELHQPTAQDILHI